MYKRDLYMGKGTMGCWTIEWYEKYLIVARPGPRGDEFAADNLRIIRAGKCMQEP